MQATLHQYTGTTKRYGFVDLLADLFKRPYVSIRSTGPPVKRTESTDNVTNIRVINVSIDDVSNDVFRMTAGANLISGRAHLSNVMRHQQLSAVINRDAFTAENSFENVLCF